jgi:hypothetical protein
MVCAHVFVAQVNGFRMDTVIWFMLAFGINFSPRKSYHMHGVPRTPRGHTHEQVHRFRFVVVHL